jgi:hypothetical protein
MWGVTPFALASLLLACAGTSDQGGVPATDREGVAEVAREVGTQPLHISVRLPPSVAAAVRSLGAGTSGPLPTIRLTLEGVRAEGDASGIRVFVGLPPDTRDLAVDSPHFVGSLAFGHTGPFETTPTDSFLINIAPALSRLRADARLMPGSSGDMLMVTIAARPSQAGVAPAPIYVKRVSITLPAAGVDR